MTKTFNKPTKTIPTWPLTSPWILNNMNNTTSTPSKHPIQATNQSKAADTRRPPIRISPTTHIPTKHPIKHKNEADLKVGTTDKTIGPTAKTGLTVGITEIEAEALTDYWPWNSARWHLMCMVTEPNSVSMSFSNFLRIVRISIHWTVLNTIWWTKRRSDVADVLGDFSQISQKIFGCIHSRLLEIFSALHSYRYRSFKVKSWIEQLCRKKY